MSALKLDRHEAGVVAGFLSDHSFELVTYIRELGEPPAAATKMATELILQLREYSESNPLENQDGT